MFVLNNLFFLQYIDHIHLLNAPFAKLNIVNYYIYQGEALPAKSFITSLTQGWLQVWEYIANLLVIYDLNECLEAKAIQMWAYLHSIGCVSGAGVRNPERTPSRMHERFDVLFRYKQSICIL